MIYLASKQTRLPTNEHGRSFEVRDTLMVSSADGKAFCVASEPVRASKVFSFGSFSLDKQRK